jgi:hypothetical protein
MGKVPSITLLCIGLSLAAFAPGRAYATLGGTVDSVESDRISFSAVEGGVIAGTGYTVHTIESGAAVIREYVSAQGIVFAIAWEGMRTPNLTTLLGSYAEQYEAALANTPRTPGVKHLSVKGDDVVVERWGQVGDLQGRAYAPSLIPTDVSIDEIK